MYSLYSKNNAFVQFPFEGLDLEEYGIVKTDKEKRCYNLYGIIVRYLVRVESLWINVSRPLYSICED